MANDDRAAWEKYRNMRNGNGFSPSHQFRTFTPEVYPPQPFSIQASSRTMELATSPNLLTSLPSHDRSRENERFRKTLSPRIIPSLEDNESSGEVTDPAKSSDYHYGRRNVWPCPPSSMEVGQNHVFFENTGADFVDTSHPRPETNLPYPQWPRSVLHEGQLSGYRGAHIGYDPGSSGGGYSPCSFFSYCPGLTNDDPNEAIHTHQHLRESIRKIPRLIEISPGVEVVLRGADEVSSCGDRGALSE
jgi:hypothetical protein